MVDLTVELAGLRLRNPLMSASGTFGHGLEMGGFVAPDGLGAWVSKTVTLEPLGLTRVGGPDDEQSIIVTGTGATMGGLHPIFFTYGEAEGSEILVPVLDGSLPEYELFVPSAIER